MKTVWGPRSNCQMNLSSHIPHIYIFHRCLIGLSRSSTVLHTRDLLYHLLLLLQITSINQKDVLISLEYPERLSNQVSSHENCVLELNKKLCCNSELFQLPPPNSLPLNTFELPRSTYRFLSPINIQLALPNSPSPPPRFHICELKTVLAIYRRTQNQSSWIPRDNGSYFWGSQKFYVDFQLLEGGWGLAPLTPRLSKGQL